VTSKQRVNRWSPRSRHGVHLVLANPYAGEREEWYPNDCHSLIDARDHDEIVGGLRAEIERLTELLDRKSSVAYEDAQDRVAAETPAESAPLTLRDFGYAPGNYTCICFSCSGQFVGDKRAIQCERCATEKLARSQVKTGCSGPSFDANGSPVTLCPSCKTELAFSDDVCGLCFPVAQP
jgi:hypothetical protein